MQRAQLHDQAGHAGRQEAGAEEILPKVSQTSVAQEPEDVTNDNCIADRGCPQSGTVRQFAICSPEVDIHRSVAQLAEQPSPKRQVGGSSPSAPASWRASKYCSAMLHLLKIGTLLRLERRKFAMGTLVTATGGNDRRRASRSGRDNSAGQADSKSTNPAKVTRPAWG